METSQETFWKTNFGNEYSKRDGNNNKKLLNSNVNFFKEILGLVKNVRSIAEFGCNIGLNLLALKKIRPDLDLNGFEINLVQEEIIPG